MSNRKESPLRILVEVDDSAGRGYQINVQDGPIRSIIQRKPPIPDIGTAMRLAHDIFDETNEKRYGGKLLAENCVGFDNEAVRVNSKQDVNARRFLHDLEKGDFSVVRPAAMDAQAIRDANIRVERKGVVDGKESIKINITNTGLFLTLFTISREHDSEMPDAKEMIKGYCRLLASRGYGKSATEIKEELDSMSEDAGTAWIERTMDIYNVTDDDLNYLAYMYLRKDKD